MCLEIGRHNSAFDKQMDLQSSKLCLQNLNSSWHSLLHGKMILGTQ